MVAVSAFLRRLALESGLQQPQAAARSWWRERHWALACLAAVPVWIGLAWAMGPALHQPATLTAWLGFVVLWPLLEELLFRGLLQGQLLRVTESGGQPSHLGPISWANGLTTLAFVAVHLPAQPLGWALAVAVPSLVLGHLRERLASVWPAVWLHMVYNAGFGLAAWSARYHESLP